ncbi:hypothetical protein Taro_009239 [Colocasia esculenta]|uniref:Uncharacterized protein n=1 Tax=Colocasia esculenta TaxID=4460 RepID=A0A843U3F8_COLES|nr:hypothetical protein [Colocasia esculenta]
MGDSTSMTIEFLRARLLSERSVSRSARQRADQLAKRVLELEEQLRIVTIQRRKAEKAASEVLAILELQGVNDFPEVIDSSSDRDHITDESKGSVENAKEDETSTASRMDRSDVEDGMSGSEVEISNPQGRSLSWKSRNNSSDSSEKGKKYQARQRHGRGFISRIGSSPQHLSGKSCRRIKSSRDIGSASENGGSKGIQPDQTSDCADDETQLSKETYDTEQEKLEENILCSSEDQTGHPVVDLYADGFGRDEAMEKALQQQAQLIVQYQAEENAQREWEEKYNENNSPELASCKKHEMLINTAEDKDASCEETRLADETITSDKETNMSDGNTGGQDEPLIDSRKREAAIDSDGPAVANIHASDVQPSCAVVDGLIDQKCPRTSAHEYGNGFREFDFAGPLNSHVETREKQCPEPFDDHSNLQPSRNELVGSTSTESPSSSKSSLKFSKRQWSLVQSQIHKDLSEPPNRDLGNVLDALQLAKQSLRQELNNVQHPPMPVPSGAWAAASDSQPLATRSDDSLGIQFGPAGLFRLPTDLNLQADLPRTNYYDPGLSMPTLRSLAGYSDGYLLNTRSETRTAVASTRMPGVPVRTGMSTYTSGNAYATTDLTARTSSYGRLPNSSYMGMTREVSGIDAHNVSSPPFARRGGAPPSVFVSTLYPPPAICYLWRSSAAPSPACGGELFPCLRPRLAAEEALTHFGFSYLGRRFCLFGKGILFSAEVIFSDAGGRSIGCSEARLRQSPFGFVQVWFSIDKGHPFS